MTGDVGSPCACLCHPGDRDNRENDRKGKKKDESEERWKGGPQGIGMGARGYSIPGSPAAPPRAREPKPSLQFKNFFKGLAKGLKDFLKGLQKV